MLESAKLIGAGAATIASAGAAIGIGNVFSSLIHGVARNPSLAKQSNGYAILGFALTEAIALFARLKDLICILIVSLSDIRKWKQASPRKCPSFGVGVPNLDSFRDPNHSPVVSPSSS